MACSKNRLEIRNLSLAIVASVVLLAGCTQQDHDHRIVISVSDQAMNVYLRNQLIARYDVSTSRFGVGDSPGFYSTPLGRMSVAKKIGEGAPLGMVFKDRIPTGEVLAVNAPGRDPIVTRILWLKGLEPQNQNAFRRCIYIHGTPVENEIGKPASYGCIRMRSTDIEQLFATVGVGTVVDVVEDHLPPPPLTPTQTETASAVIR